MTLFTRTLTRFSLIAFILIPLTQLTAQAAEHNKEAQLKAAPDFAIKDQQRLSDLKGKVVYIDFWASWCGPCRKSFPWLNQINAKYSSDDFVVLSINTDAQRKLADKFLAKFPADFSVTYDPMGDLARIYQVKGMPSSYLIDHNGNIATSHVGFRSKKIAGYEQQIEHLIKRKQQDKQ